MLIEGKAKAFLNIETTKPMNGRTFGSLAGRSLAIIDLAIIDLAIIDLAIIELTRARTDENAHARTRKSIYFQDIIKKTNSS